MTFDKLLRSSPKKVFLGFFRLFFHLLYHQMAWTYDWVAAAVSLGRWKKWVYTPLPYLEGPRILELGHGPGHLQIKMHARGNLVVGLDESRQMGLIAHKRLRNSGCSPLLVNGYAQSLPFPDGCFDQVVATFPSEYIAQMDTLNQINRVLQDGGILWILPVAWITGEKLSLRAAAWLFQVTGQSPEKDRVVSDERIAKLFDQSRFAPKYIEKKYDESSVLIIKAVKMGSPEFSPIKQRS